MLRHTNGKRSGFTLIELAIVLGVAGILFGGLWRILSTSNVQMRDQATASQQAQLIGAISTYLQTSNGQNWLAQIHANTAQELPIPTQTHCPPSTDAPSATDAPNICNSLPPGFYGSGAGTYSYVSLNTNPYGQNYTISILKDSTPGAGQAGGPLPPQTYSFMILTSGGDPIPDTSGGRISAGIGGDGGFVYSSNVCGIPANYACGAYGSWSTLLSTYGLPSGSGVVASRTYYSPMQNVSDLWLARKPVSGDASFIYNTMTTPLYLGYVAGVANTGAFYLDGFGGPVTDGGTIYMQGGTINLNAGNTAAQNQTAGHTGGTIDLGGSGWITGTSPNVNVNPFIDLSMTNGAPNGSLITLDSVCTRVTNSSCVATAILIDHGDIVLNDGTIMSTKGYSYNGSDMRLKTNIKPLSNALADIMNLKPVSFNFKANGKASMGVIAQDLEKIYPQLVIKTGPDDMRFVAYDGLIAPLIGSVQELKKANDDLTAQLRDQAARQKELEKEIENLRRK